MDQPQYFVYIMTDEARSRLYTGWTGDLRRRAAQHRSGNGGVYTRRYSLVRLVYFEMVEDEPAARLRERQIKRGGKRQRVKLVEQINPGWEDLFVTL